MSTGKINVNTENIFPIIKKFLYSDHEIFLRELVSNAVDACQKLKTLASAGEFKDEIGDLKVEILIDKEKKTLTIRDNGIGMNQEEVDKYINQIAFSSAEEFVSKYKDKGDANAIIGHFGLGFYSAFMVSEKVELITKTHKKGKGNTAVKWECDGSPEYTISDSDKKTRGTDVVLFINEESIEFLESARIKTLLDKYCKFLPVNIEFEGASINNTKPAWTRKPADLSPEDYLSFYKEIYPYSEDPLFHIHLNVDYPFNLTGVLYFPKLKKNVEVQKNKIQLYSNQVFVTDSVEGIVPEFLTLLHGVIDSPDIPLNVSRSYLQSDGNVKKISGHIMKKVADKLDEEFKEQRENFEKRWDDLKVFISYGMLSEEKFYDRAKSFYLIKTTKDEYIDLDSLVEKVKPLQTDKHGKTIILYATNLDAQHAFIDAATNRGYTVMLMDGVFDSHMVNSLEQKIENTSFVRVDSNTIDKLIEKEEVLPSKLSAEQEETLKKDIEEFVTKEKFTVTLEAMSESESPFHITIPEFMRRMKDMAAIGGGGMDFMSNMPEHYNLVVNSNHPLSNKILDEKDESKKKAVISQAFDLALLSQNMLKGEDLTKFIRRSIELI